MRAILSGDIWETIAWTSGFSGFWANANVPASSKRKSGLSAFCMRIF
jgi:hypothetical protein